MRVSLRTVAVLSLLVGCDRPSSTDSKAAPKPSTAATQGEASADEPGAPADLPQTWPTEAHAFSVQDIVSMHRVSTPSVSPDGKRVVYSLSAKPTTPAAGGSELWIGDVGPNAPRKLLGGKGRHSSPLWSADGKWIYFMSTRSGSSQVWRMPAAGGEPSQVSDAPVDLHSVALSPDGTRYAVSADVFPACSDLKCTAAKLAEQEASVTSGRVYDQLFVRHWDTWKDGRRHQLWVGNTDGGALHRVSGKVDADVTSKPWGGAEEVTFTPDSKAIVFTARAAGAEEPWSTNFDLYKVDADATDGAAESLTDNPAWDTAPVFSPDGKTLAYLAHKRPMFEADRFAIMLRNWKTGETRELAPEWDRSARHIAFSPDGGQLLVTAQNLGQVSVFVVSVADGEVTELVHDGTNSGGAWAGERVVYRHNSLSGPDELWTINANGSDAAALTKHNDAHMAATKVGEYEQFQFKGWNNETVHGYVVKPADFSPDKKTPVAFLIHGGPQGSFGNRFHYRWNPQTYAGAGYAAVMIDFHGSTGYGQAFTDAISEHWGDRPLEDLQKGLEAALANNPWMDGDNICALGASYGGYMINWIAGNWPDRFKCLVNHDGVFDARMMYYATEELWFTEWENGGPYFKNPQGHERFNPVHHVDKWKTPMLVIQGALDYRIPETQGIAAFTALQRRGIPSKFLFFPDENHWVLNPDNSVQWHNEVGAWLDAHLKPQKVTAQR